MRHQLSLLIFLAFALPLAAQAGAPHPTRHGGVTISARVCDRTVSFRRALVSPNLLTLTGRLGKRKLNYWNESPQTSYLYGVSTFVKISEAGHVLTVRAVRLVPVCAPLTITYTW